MKRNVATRVNRSHSLRVELALACSLGEGDGGLLHWDSDIIMNPADRRSSELALLIFP